MVKKNTAAPKAPAGRPDVANMPRQSHVAYADYIHTLVNHGGEQLQELIDAGVITPAQVDATQEAIAAAVAENRFTSTADQRVEKVLADKVQQAVAALTNDAPLTGYKGFAFDSAAFAAKVAPKTGRKRLSPEDKAAKVVEEASPEQLAALAALLKARGLDGSDGSADTE